MSTWYYYDSKGQKQGPVTGGQLKGLAKAGRIMPETMVETEDGKTAPARRVKGLTFGEVAPSQVPALPSPTEPNPFSASPPVLDNPFTGAPPVTPTMLQSIPVPSPQLVQSTTSSKMNEQFSVLMNTTWTIKDSTLAYGKQEIPYTQLSPIRMVISPTFLTNGVAQVDANGKILTLAYPFKDRERVTIAITYANEQIELAHGNVKGYKYLLLAHTGTKLEVYEEYLILYFVPPGIIANALRGGSTGGKRLSYSNITAIQFMEPAGVSVGFIQFTYPGSGESKGGVIAAIEDENSIPVSPQKLELAREIVKYIEEKRQGVKSPVGQTIVNQQVSSADELLKYKSLLDNGVITQEEFDIKKKQLLGL